MSRLGRCPHPACPLALAICALSAAWVGILPAACAEDLLACWSFDQVQDGTTVERGGGVEDSIGGNFKLTAGVAGKALRFDGFTTEIVRPAKLAPRLPDSFAIEAWVALGAYPWNWCPLIEQRSGTNAGYSAAIGPRGQVRLAAAAGSQWNECVSKDYLLPLRQWAHVVATCERGKGLAVYFNGEEACRVDVGETITPAADADLRIGAIPAPAKPSNIHREYGTLPGWFSIDGLVDELKIHPRALSPAEVKAAMAAARPSSEPELPLRKMPSGPPGPGRFGGYYTQLKFHDAWDALWRVGPDPDVLVRFDDSPVRVVFWRGTRYSPAWVSENDLWMADQSVEAWNDVEGCYEHMQDPKCLYSHVRIIENTDARVVVHWRYAPVSAHNHLWNVDPKTGFACWVDEYYTIYPDAAGTRHVTWQRGTLRGPRQFQESLPFTHPGQSRSEVVQTNFCTVANLKGETATISYVDNPQKPKPGLPADLMLQLYNFRARYSPFIIYESGNRMTGVNDRSVQELSGKGGCDHWPVGQLPCDGRTSLAADRATHFNGFPISNPPIHHNDTREWWTGLYGMTSKPVVELVKLARSWNQPPELVLRGKGFRSNGYDRGQRAYEITCENAQANATLECEIRANPNSPLMNVPLVIRGWGDAGAILKINGKAVLRGKQFRFGHVRRLEGSDLTVWIQLETTHPTTLRITRDT